MAASVTQTMTALPRKDALVSSGGLVKSENVMGDSFPAGLRVLVVDDDPICLLILDRMLRQCLYQVTTCGRATEALKLLRENRNGFDLVISDVIMPDMDGFKLLELVGLEMDLPVIMMSANGETSAVMKGVKHGACDYLLKPVRMEELRNIWQHVVRKRYCLGRHESCHDDYRSRPIAEDGDYASPPNEALDGVLRHARKRKDSKEEDDEPDPENEDSSTTKKPRVVWSVDLHQQFVNAVNQLGIDKAVPKRILELMSVHGLTRENVASHLQKYRLYLKRISGVNHHPGGINSAFTGATDPNFVPVGATGFGGFGTIAGSSHVSPQGLMSASQTGLFGNLGRQPADPGLRAMDQSLLLQIASCQHQNGHNDNFSQSSYGKSGQPNLHDPKQLTATQQMGAFAGSLDKGAMGISSVPPLASVLGIGQSTHTNNLISNNNPSLLQPVKQQASHICGVGSVTLPGNAHGISPDINVWGTASVSSVGGVSSVKGSSVVVASPSRPNSSCISDLLESLTRTGIGNTALNAADVCGSQPFSPNVPSVDLTGLTDAAAANVESSLSLRANMGDMRSVPLTMASPLDLVGLNNLGGGDVPLPLSLTSEMSLQNSNSATSNYSSMSGVAVHGRGHQAGIQEVMRSRFGLSPPISGSGLSPGLGQTLITSHEMNMLSGGIEGGLAHIMTTVSSNSSTIKQSYETQHMKHFPVDMKRDPACLVEPCSNDLLNIVLKQQQPEVLNAIEGELAVSDAFLRHVG